MKKLFALLFVLMLIGFTSNSNAQISLGVGGGIGLPMGNFGDVAEMGFGGLVRGEYPMSDDMNLTFTTGYLMFGGKELGVPGASVKSSWSAIPLLAGAKYFFGDGLYGMAEVGLNMLTVKVEMDLLGSKFESDASESKIGYSAGVGYELPLGDAMKLDLGVKYQALASDATFIGIFALLKFGL